MRNPHAFLDEQAAIWKKLEPLIRLLDAPADLREFLPIIKQFQKVLVLYAPLSIAEEAQAIARLQQLVGEILSGDIPVEKYFPAAEGSRRRHSMKPYNEERPHYCSYWNTCQSPEVREQHLALLASFLPIQFRLQMARKQAQRHLQDGAYKVGLALRQLTRPEPRERDFLAQLPVEATPATALRERFETIFLRHGIHPRVTGSYRNFGCLLRALRWYETGVWDFPLPLRQRSATTHKSPRRGGRADDEIDVAISISHTSEFGPPIHTTIFYPTDGEVSTTSKNSADEDPVQDGGDVGVLVDIPTQPATAFNRGDRMLVGRKAARYAAQAIEMANQRLPVTHATLTGYEIKTFLDAVLDIAHPAWSDVELPTRPKVAAWAACRFFIGRDPDSLQYLEVCNTESEPDLPSPIWFAREQRLWLPCQQPHHSRSGGADHLLDSDCGFMLHINEILTQCLKGVRPKYRKIFPASLEPEFKTLLANLNRTTGCTLTPERIAGFIAGMMARMAPKDEVFALYFRGLVPNQHNPSVYSALPAARIDSLYQSACNHALLLAGQAIPDAHAANFPTLVSAEDQFVGSKRVPTLDSLKKLVLDAQMGLAEKRATLGTAVHELHNAYTAYVVLFLLATTGIRAVGAPIPALFSLDRHTGSCFVSDKDSNNYRNARIVWLHPLMVRQLDAYSRHVIRLRQYLARTSLEALDRLDARQALPMLSSQQAPNREKDQHHLHDTIAPLFLIGEYGGHPVPIARGVVEAILGQDIHLRLMELRHFVRTQLMLSGCAGDLINILLGHAERGESPWAKFSTLAPWAWRQKLAEHLQPIVDSLGFNVLKSPLLC